MVKVLDEKNDWPNHVGWDLWRASRLWQQDFVVAMQAAGHGWMTDARALLLGYLDLQGTPQARLVARMGLSKQAVQQLIDGLETEGILVRIADPEDRRGRIVIYTEAGRAAMRDANVVKLAIETSYRQKMGGENYRHLKSALASLLANPDHKNIAKRQR